MCVVSLCVTGQYVCIRGITIVSYRGGSSIVYPHGNRMYSPWVWQVIRNSLLPLRPLV